MPLGKIGIFRDCKVELPTGQLDREIYSCGTKERNLATEDSLDYLHAWVVLEYC